MDVSGSHALDLLGITWPAVGPGMARHLLYEWGPHGSLLRAARALLWPRQRYQRQDP